MQTKEQILVDARPLNLPRNVSMDDVLQVQLKLLDNFTYDGRELWTSTGAPPEVVFK